MENIFLSPVGFACLLKLSLKCMPFEARKSLRLSHICFCVVGHRCGGTKPEPHIQKKKNTARSAEAFGNFNRNLLISF